MALGIRKGDEVMIVAGKDKGSRAKVLKVYPDKGRLEVEGYNIAKRHTKPTTASPQGGIISKTAPMDVSNVMLWCGECDKPVRSGARWVGSEGSVHKTPQLAWGSFDDKPQGKGRADKVRVCRSCERRL